jgi:hypothetical protein
MCFAAGSLRRKDQPGRRVWGLECDRVDGQILLSKWKWAEARLQSSREAIRRYGWRPFNQGAAKKQTIDMFFPKIDQGPPFCEEVFPEEKMALASLCVAAIPAV